MTQPTSPSQDNSELRETIKHVFRNWGHKPSDYVPVIDVILAIIDQEVLKQTQVYRRTWIPKAEGDRRERLGRIDELQRYINILNNVYDLVPNDHEYGSGKQQMMVDIMQDLNQRIKRLQSPSQPDSGSGDE